MGLLYSTCSHENHIISNIDPSTYTDQTETWRFKVADMQCKDCNEKMRAIKKTCIDHNISQLWEPILPVYCTHDIVKIIDKTYNESEAIYYGRYMCVACFLSVPIKAENNGKSSELDWDINKQKYVKEINDLSKTKKTKEN
jgi:hypothetical protein